MTRQGDGEAQVVAPMPAPLGQIHGVGLLRLPSLPQFPSHPLSFARSLGLVHASGAGCSCPLSVHSPWWRGMGSAGSEGSINKLVRCPDLEELHHPVLLSAVHLGGGRRDGRGSISGVHYLGSGSSPPVLEMKLRLRSSSTRRRPFWSNGSLVIPPGQVCQKGGHGGCIEPSGSSPA